MDKSSAPVALDVAYEVAREDDDRDIVTRGKHLARREHDTVTVYEIVGVDGPLDRQEIAVYGDRVWEMGVEEVISTYHRSEPDARMSARHS